MVGWGVMVTIGAETKGDMACDITGMGFISAVMPISSWSLVIQGICGAATICLS